MSERDAARLLCIELAEGCGNHGCRFKAPEGMATNGPCCCHEKIIAAWNRRPEAGWVSVEERLPEKPSMYLVWCSDLTVHVTTHEWTGDSWDDPVGYYDITHWRPLPAGPEGGA